MKNKIKLILIYITIFIIQISMYQITRDYKKTEDDIEIMQNISNINSESKIQENSWKIEIPKIELKAEIAEGTSKEILNKYVGHFENTQTEIGNIGLAAHNRGYEVNYFEKLKLLQEGDEIIYQFGQNQKIYEVEKNIIIKDTDWERLENTEDNQLTLITCVENEPEYRRCVQALEREEIVE